MSSSHRRLYGAVLILVIFTFSFPWLMLVKSLASPSYQWGFFAIGGIGTQGSFWAIPSAVAIGLVLLSAPRFDRRLFLSGSLVCFLMLFAVLLRAAVTSSGAMTFQAATLGVILPLGLIGPGLYAVSSLLAVLALVAELRHPTPLHPTRWDQRALLGAALLTPVAVAGARLGVPIDGLVAKVGVAAAITQWILLASALGAARERDGSGSQARAATG
jgi:hypothetical protein